MYCHYTQVFGELRIYDNDDGYTKRDEYKVIVSVIWTDDKTVIFRSTKGKADRKSIICAFQEIYNQGAETIIIKRSKNKTMPFSILIDENEYEKTFKVDLIVLKNAGLIH
jgi:hypothetical protein